MQSDYEALMGSDPSTFDGEGLPVDNISWLEAVQYANVRSNAAGLTPVYTIGDGEVVCLQTAAACPQKPSGSMPAVQEP